MKRALITIQYIAKLWASEPLYMPEDYVKALRKIESIASDAIKEEENQDVHVNRTQRRG